MPMNSATRYVVLEWTGAGSSRPLLAESTVYSSLIDAHDEASAMEADAKRDGRPNTFTVHAVDMDPIWR
jgi:hypothetical protein